MVQKATDGVVVRVYQHKAQDLGLGDSWTGQCRPLGLFPLPREQNNLFKAHAVSASFSISKVKGTASSPEHMSSGAGRQPSHVGCDHIFCCSVQQGAGPAILQTGKGRASSTQPLNFNMHVSCGPCTSTQTPASAGTWTHAAGHGPWRQLGLSNYHVPSRRTGHPDQYDPSGSMTLEHHYVLGWLTKSQSNFMILGGNRNDGHQSDPEWCRAMDPDMAKYCNLDPDITMALAQATQIITAPATARPSDTNMATGDGSDPRYPYGFW